jgi:integrase
MSLERDLAAALSTWVDTLSPHTRKAYERGLVQFADYLVAEGLLVVPRAAPTRGGRAPVRRNTAAQRSDLVAASGRYLLELDAGRGNALVQAFVQHLSALDQETGLPSYTRATVHQRVCALRWAVREARRRGLVSWTLEVVVPRPSKDSQTGRPRVKPGRDMRGPTAAQLRQMLDAATARARGSSGDGARWLLILSLIAHETLREHEICAIDLADIDRASGTLSLVRKKEDQPSTIPLSRPTRNALRRWIERRGTVEGPVLWGSKQGGTLIPGSRLTVDGIYYIVRKLGERCGLSTSPHKVRHTAITLGQAVREQLGIPLHDAMLRAGHRSIEAHERYLDPDVQNVRRLNDGVARLLREASA